MMGGFLDCSHLSKFLQAQYLVRLPCCCLTSRRTSQSEKWGWRTLLQHQWRVFSKKGGMTLLVAGRTLKYLYSPISSVKSTKSTLLSFSRNVYSIQPCVLRLSNVASSTAQRWQHSADDFSLTKDGWWQYRLPFNGSVLRPDSSCIAGTNSGGAAKIS